MANTFISKQTFVRSLLFALGVTTLMFMRSFALTSTRMVFCDVGQGDGAYIRTSDNIDILIDAGPNKSILNCLGKYMPFYDKTIEAVFISHPQKDHFGGFLYVLDRYDVENIVMTPITSDAKEFKELEKLIIDKRIPISVLFSGDSLQIGENAQVELLWPRKQYIVSRTESSNEGSGDVLGLIFASGDANNYSQILLYKERGFDVLFTGDASPDIFEILTDLDIKKKLDGGLEILKVPHHGSKNGLTSTFLEYIDPKLSIISVGENNRFSHPSEEVKQMYRKQNKIFATTAESEDIIINLSEDKWNTNVKL